MDIMSGTSTSFQTAMVYAKNAPAQKPADQDIEKTAKQFEGVFISEMLSHMFEGSKTDPMFGGGQAEDMYKSMLVNEYGKKMSEGNGIGISSQIKSMMIQMQQHANGGNA